MKMDMIIFAKAAKLDPRAMKRLEKIEIPRWSGGIDFGYEDKLKKEKKMSKKATHEDVQEALEAFAEELGLDYSSCREELDGGTISDKFLPEQNDLSKELTQETKEAPETRQQALERYYLGFGYGSYHPTREQQKEATILGKVNALADFLGVEFKVTPESVKAESVKAVKKATPRKSKVTAKKGKK